MGASATNVFAEGGDWGPGSGGDMCEARIQEIAYDIQHWIAKGGAENLSFPQGLKAQDYAKKMNKVLDNTVIECVDKKLFLNPRSSNRIAKTCINDMNYVSGETRIRCVSNVFMDLEAEEQYRLVHHEFAGLAGLERNVISQGKVEEKSSYVISQQIGAFLENVTIKRLAVKKSDEKTYWLDESACSIEDLEELAKTDLLTGYKTKFILSGCKTLIQMHDFDSKHKYILRQKYKILFTAVPIDGYYGDSCEVEYDTGGYTSEGADYPTLKVNCGGEAMDPSRSYFYIPNSKWESEEELYEMISQASKLYSITNDSKLGKEAIKLGFKID